jgi:hypothetical protein
LQHRNQLLRNQIQSVKVIYTKPHTSEGHVKIFLRTRAARDSILLRGKASILGTNHRIIPVDLDREVRRCFKCQGYGHTQKFCPAATPACGRCAMPHQTSDCVNPSALKCVNCGGSHRSGDKLCQEQIKAVARYRAFFFLDSHV